MQTAHFAGQKFPKPLALPRRISMADSRGWNHNCLSRWAICADGTACSIPPLGEFTMTRSIPALAAALALFAATASAAPVALKDLTTPVLQEHFKSYFVVDEAKITLTSIAPFATLDPGGLRVTEYGIVWDYTA